MTSPESIPPLPFYNPAAFAFDTEVAIALIADMQIRKAIERGEFDDLPGSGEPRDLPDHHDPDWWLKSLMKRERIMMLPPSIQLRKDDAALDAELDQLSNDAAVRHEVEQFNERVIRARYQLPAGPPLVTMPRDVEATVAAWADRRATRAEEAHKKADEESQAREGAKRNDRNRRRLFRKRTSRSTRRGTEK
ncbi:DnaJ family domain-containing protein [Microbacterium murale]|uniref:DnaJ homologue subfamily C member 28 conserved domain-containing protein n=1 Tax=Microbacterium murale TaxID=1081040 RepID=A0ABQ1S0F8_9MICO|nr:DUF1992 domain-containing protein [Microbacterium murale]GGD86081.1 hypothetical protein GCM10007269_31280 [Microbacterium murale]